MKNEKQKRLVKTIYFNQGFTKTFGLPDIVEREFLYYKNFTNKFNGSYTEILNKKLDENSDTWFNRPNKNDLFGKERDFEIKYTIEEGCTYKGFRKYKNLICYKGYDIDNNRIIFEEFYIPGPKIMNLDKTLFIIASNYYSYNDSENSHMFLNKGKITYKIDSLNKEITFPYSGLVKHEEWIYKDYDNDKNEWKISLEDLSIEPPIISNSAFSISHCTHTYKPKLLFNHSFLEYDDKLCVTDEDKNNIKLVNKEEYSKIITNCYNYNLYENYYILSSIERHKQGSTNCKFKTFFYKFEKTKDRLSLPYYTKIERLWTFDNRTDIKEFEYEHDKTQISSIIDKRKYKDGKIRLFKKSEIYYSTKNKNNNHPINEYFHYYDKNNKIIERETSKYCYIFDKDYNVVGAYLYFYNLKMVSELIFTNIYN